MSVTHRKVSAVSDGGDSTKVRPSSDWNDTHSITDILPEADATSDLGSIAKTFAEAHVETVFTDTISEHTGAAGVTIDGVLLKDSTVKTDTIIEKTGAAGVTLDGVLLKDDDVTAAQVFTDDIQQKTAAAGIKLSHNPYPGTDSAIDFGKTGATWQLGWFEGIQFPATQVASAGANVLDDYEEGTWDGTLTFSTAGDFSAAYTSNTCAYTKVGRIVHVHGRILTSAFTHSTASGELRILGLPFAAVDIALGSVGIRGFSDTAYTWLSLQTANSTTLLNFLASRNNNTLVNADSGDCATGNTMDIRFALTYRTT